MVDEIPEIWVDFNDCVAVPESDPVMHYIVTLKPDFPIKENDEIYAVDGDGNRCPGWVFYVWKKKNLVTVEIDLTEFESEEE